MSNGFFDYLVVSDFKIDHINKLFKEEMLAVFSQEMFLSQEKKRVFNVEYKSRSYLSKITKMFENAISDNFYVSPSVGRPTTYIYCQSKNCNASAWHNHVSTSTITSVFYANTVEKGGELQFNYNGEIHNVKPEVNKLYMFPSWLMHRPLAHEDDTWRISVNLEYLTYNRAIRKDLNIIW